MLRLLDSPGRLGKEIGVSVELAFDQIFLCIRNEKSLMKSYKMQVGNAVTDSFYDNLGTVTYWWSHDMISDKTCTQLINTCDFTRQKESDECESLYSYAMDQEFGSIDQYNIDAPPCNKSDGATTTFTLQTIRLPHRPQKVYKFVYTENHNKMVTSFIIFLGILSDIEADFRL